MAEILSIGRVFDGYPVDVGSAQWSGDTLTLTGEVILATETSRVDIGKAMRDRILALVSNRDELDVAVRWTEDATVDGFYRPLNASVDYTVASLNDGVLPWSVELRRVGGGTLPQVEVHGLHTVRANQNSVSNATLNGGSAPPTVGFPFTALDAWAGAYVLVPTTRNTPNGDLYLGDVFKTLPSQFATTWTVDPEYHYVGACEIRTTHGTAGGGLVNGRWTSSSWSGSVLSNGLIRVSRDGLGTGLFIEVFDGTQWEPLNTSATRWQVESDWAGGTITWDWGAAGMQILRNGPERVSIRLFTPDAMAQATFGRVWLDLTVQRGRRHIAGVIQCDSPGAPSSNAFAIEPSVSIANTAITGAWRATSNDAQGNRAVWGAAGSSALTGNTTTGRVVQSSSGMTQMPFFIGAEIGGSSASGKNTAQHVAYQWYDIASETQRIVRR